MQLRVERARELLIYSDRSVIDVAVQAGFSSTSHFATWYKRIYGARPSEMRGGAADRRHIRHRRHRSRNRA